MTGSGLQTGWDSTIGPAIVVSDVRASSTAAIVLPGLTDSTLAASSKFELQALASTSIDLFNASGLVGNSTLEVSSQQSDQSGCVRWPIGRLITPIRSGWSVGLEKGRATGLALDSMERMRGADSTKFVADVVKAAGSIRDTGDPVFRGIPFSVRKAYRFLTTSVSTVVAEVVRKINEEATPREEHVLLVADRPSTGSEYQVGFYRRSAGNEETVETNEVLVALRLVKSNRPAIVITFDHEDGGQFGLLERVDERNWQLVWRSAYTGC